MNTNLITIHYHRFENDYQNWDIWYWTNKIQGESLSISGHDNFGVIFTKDISRFENTECIGFIIRKNNWEAKDFDNDRYLKINEHQEFWLIQDDEKIYTSLPPLTPKIIYAYVDARNKITVFLSQKIDFNNLNEREISITDDKDNKLIIQNSYFGNIDHATNSFEIFLKYNLNLDAPLHKYKIHISGYKTKYLTIRNVLADKYFYTEKKLGFIYKKANTIFRIFSPTAANISLQLYNSVEDIKPQIYHLKKKKHGIWEIKIFKNLLYKYYTYKISGDESEFMPHKELVDIYSLCNTGHYNKGLIINDKTQITNSPKFNIEDSIIYEMHIRDFTIDKYSNVIHKGKYLGLTEPDTKYNNYPTGLAHLKELGINVVQIMPIQDFDNDEADFKTYNWGYMPLSYNSPDGWYATNTTDESRVIEFKKLVDALHKNNIKVVMDVVYNHTSHNASFNKIIPRYYFRQKANGSYWNGSGCGNEFQTEFPMAQKYIIDSLKYWVNEYKIDGFRFDLMALIDLDTMIKITKELKKINKDLLIYGEPWAGGETPVKQTAKGSQKGNNFSVFNDTLRDAIKGSPFNFEYGYVQGNIDPFIVNKIQTGLLGSINDFAQEPTEAINYASCHDNHTLWDRINLSLKKNSDNIKNDVELIKRMQKLANAIILLSQGIPFLHSGEEMCRTKKGEGNSYNMDDSINAIHWLCKKKYHDVFQYYKGIISIRKAHPAFRLPTRNLIKQCIKLIDSPPGCITVMLSYNKDKWKNILVLINPLQENSQIILPEGDWNLTANESQAGNQAITKNLTDAITLAPISLCVLYKSNI